ncbi:hypothetical protein LOC71_00440 [Rhodopirellula sp. JC740]|uniref:Transmembrane protein n=1 Tax=Rhodopirellula halodulae TaxID=2894198 RepID=A0ABS8NAY8_9BACT|nr:hypothetical protein [Rhodopirellula sp. JC740]MCC9640724.1 hypothetical protein [Rhodopirellula sp. JC740]
MTDADSGELDSLESGVDLAHADKYNDPRIRVTFRHVFALMMIFVVAVIVAFGSLYARRTRLEKTTEFWGPDTITALQLGDHVELMPGPGSDFEQVELTAFPGLGHLRKALLDERHYEWDSLETAPVVDLVGTPKAPGQFEEDAGEPRVVRLEFSDPHYKRVPPSLIDVELASGTVGPADGSKRIRVNDRVRPALRHQLGLLMKVSEMRYDRRGEEKAANDEE